MGDHAMAPLQAKDEAKPKVPVTLTGANVKSQTPVPPIKPRNSVRPVSEHPAAPVAPPAATAAPASRANHESSRRGQWPASESAISPDTY